MRCYAVHKNAAAAAWQCCSLQSCCGSVLNLLMAHVHNVEVRLRNIHVRQLLVISAKPCWVCVSLSLAKPNAGIYGFLLHAPTTWATCFKRNSRKRCSHHEQCQAPCPLCELCMEIMLQQQSTDMAADTLACTGGLTQQLLAVICSECEHVCASQLVAAASANFIVTGLHPDAQHNQF